MYCQKYQVQTTSSKATLEHEWVHTVCFREQNLIPAPVDRTSASEWLYKHPWISCQKNKPSTSMSHLACELKLCSIVRSSMHPCPRNWMAIRHVVVYFARTAHATVLSISTFKELKEMMGRRRYQNKLTTFDSVERNVL